MVELVLARNIGIMSAKGKYISFLDADDSWLPNKLENQINIMKEKNLEFIHSSYFIVDENERVLGKFLTKNLHYSDLIRSCDIGLSTVTVTSKLIKENLFPQISSKEDYICWLKIIKKIKILYGDLETVTVYRKKNKSLSSGIVKKFFNAFKVYRIYEKYNLLISLLFTLRLSFYFLKKEYFIKFKNIYPLEFKYILDFEKLKFDKSFSLVALNMASLSYTNILYINHKDIVFWLDGVCAKFIIKNFYKTAGRKVLEQITLPQDLDNIYLCGKKSHKQIYYLEQKFKKKVEFIELPFFESLNSVSEYKLKIKDNSLVILNISTPKQEIISNNILNYNRSKKIFVFCLGGGIAMAAGEEEIVPENIEKMNMEWLWRLRTNTLFRLKRLIRTSFIFMIRKLFYYYNKIKFKELA